MSVAQNIAHVDTLRPKDRSMPEVTFKISAQFWGFLVKKNHIIPNSFEELILYQRGYQVNN